MFEFVRNHTRLALGFMLLLIIPSFIFFGVQGYSRFSDAGNATLARVDGQNITRSEWDDAHRRVLERVRRQSPNTDVQQFDTPQLKRDVLDGLVRDRVLLAAANQLQLFPAVPRMTRIFDSDPQFAGLRGPDGKISREQLVVLGLTPELFDQRLRQELGTQQVLGGITQTALAPAGAASAALGAFLQRRELQMQRFDPAAYRAKVTPTDADIQAFYNANTAQFKAPEQASIEYVMLDLEGLAKGVTVNDADLRKAYADSAARYAVPEERHTSHILIGADKDMPAAERGKAKARAEALLGEVRKNPAQFADLARKNSADPGSAAKGGDLDFVGRGAMVKPFEDAVFALKPGQISDVVETDFGFHIITVSEVRGGTAKPFEQARAEVQAELRRSLAQRRWAETAEQFTNTAYEQSDSLQPVVDKLKLEKKTATVLRTPPPGSSGPLVSAKFLDAVFAADSVRNKRNTDAVEVAPNQLVAARVLQHAPARTLPLADVKDRVRDSVVAQQSAVLARQDGEARLAALRASGGGGEALPMVLTASRAQSASLPKPLLDAALRADASKLPALAGVDLGPQGYVVLRVMRLLPAETPPGSDEAMRAQYAQAWAAAEADAYIAALKKRFKADLKPAAEAAFGEAASAPAR